MTERRWLAVLITAVVVLALLALGVRAATDDRDRRSAPPETTAPEPGEATEPSAPGASGPVVPADPDGPIATTDPVLDAALSTPVEDSYYPDVGEPDVDSLHHDLRLAWDPDTRILSGTDTLTFRAVADTDSFQLDLGEPLTVSEVRLDQQPVEFERADDALVVSAAIEADQRYAVEVDYQGTPESVPAPTTRTDIENLGWTITEDGEVWTMQEPYGAFTWYPVNDQPSDKALYDFTIAVPDPMVGIANGQLTDRSSADGITTTHFTLDSPAASYLVTIAIGDYAMAEQETASGLPITLWAPTGDTAAMRRLRYSKRAIEWIERRLGRFPFSTAGAVAVPSQSAMETQTLITVGNADYPLSPVVLVHEYVHQWYGDKITPTDWRDVWMNEGMTMYLQAEYEAETSGRSVDAVLDEWATFDQQLRDQAGPPGDYDATAFAEGNVYYCPALMWHQVRAELDDDIFWAMVRAWPDHEPDGNAGREEYLAWLSDVTDHDFTELFDAWLLGDTTPPR